MKRSVKSSSRARMGSKRGSLFRHPLGWGLTHASSAFARRNWPYLMELGRAIWEPGCQLSHHHRHGYLMHLHDRGQVGYSIRDSSHVARPGQVCLMRMSDPARYTNTGATRATFFYLFFDGAEMGRVFQTLDAASRPVFHAPDMPRLKSIFRDLFGLVRQRGTGCEPRSAALITLMLAELFASREPHPPTPPALETARPLSDPVRLAVEVMQTYYHSSLSTKQVASRVGLSYFHFSRRFKRETGTTPSACLTSVRLEQAAHLLSHSGHNMAEIARMVGFGSQNYFTRRFHQAYKLTPTEYRRRELRKSRREATRGGILPARNGRTGLMPPARKL